MDSTTPVAPAPRRDLRQQRSLSLLAFSSVPEALRQPGAATPPPTEAVMMLSNHGELFQLNLVAAFVWDLLDGATTIDQLAAQVTEVFEVDGDRARADVEALLGRLDELGLLAA
jgi:hypothetical protein